MALSVAVVVKSQFSNSTSLHFILYICVLL